MSFALLHATLGWLLAGLAAFLFRRRTPDARCWAWRFGLLKGPLALALAIPVVTPMLVPPPGTFPFSATKGREGEPWKSGLPGAKPSRALMTVEGNEREDEAHVEARMRASDSNPMIVSSENASPPLLLIFYFAGFLTVLAVRFLRRKAIPSSMPRVEGVFRPRIVVPDDMEPQAAAMARAHEEAHVRRRDPQWSCLAELVCVAFWFAPPVWLCARSMRAEAEAACDAAALAETRASRKAYASLLLAHAGLAPANALGGSARRLARRILMLEHPSKPLPRLAWASLLVLGSLFVLPWRAVAETASSSSQPSLSRTVPAVRLPLERAAKLMLDEPGVKAKIGWTAAQDDALRSADGRWKRVWDAFAAELYSRQRTQTLRQAFMWDSENRSKALARADAAAEPYPWTQDQQRKLAALALARFGSGVWQSPVVDAQLHLTFAQKLAIHREDAAISHYAFVEMQDPVLKAAEPMPARTKREIASLEKQYLDAPAASRQALKRQIAAIQSRYQPVYGPWSPEKRRQNVERVDSQTWRMRANANRRLEALLSPAQREVLERLNEDPAAWKPPVAIAPARRPKIANHPLSSRPTRIWTAKLIPSLRSNDGWTFRSFKVETKTPYPLSIVATGLPKKGKSSPPIPPVWPELRELKGPLGAQ